MAEVAQGQAHKKGGSPLGTFLWIMGALCLLFWIAILLDEIQTTEAAMGLNLGHSLAPNWLVLWQPIALVTGTLSSESIGPIIVGWIVELFVLIFTFAYEIGSLFVKRHNSILAKPFVTVCVAALAWDGWTNWTSGFGGATFQGQFIFTITLAAGAVLLPIGALACFKMAQAEG